MGQTKATIEKKRVFLIDDSSYTGNFLREVFRGTEFFLSGQAHSLKEAMRKYPQSLSTLVLLDTTIPDAEVIDVIRALKAINPEVRIVLMGPLLHLPLIQELLGREADSFIFKPIETRALFAVLRSFYPVSDVKLSKSKIIAILYSGFFQELRQYLLPSLVDSFQEITLDAYTKANLNGYLNLKFEPFSFIPVPYVRGKTLKRRLSKFYEEVFRAFCRRLGKKTAEGLFTDAYHSFHYEYRHILHSLGSEDLFPTIDGFYLEFAEPQIPVEQTNGRAIRESKFSQISVTTQEQPLEHALENLEIYVVLSAFDAVLGPKVLAAIPTPQGLAKKRLINDIPQNMDLVGTESEEPFLMISHNWATMNTLFTIKDAGVRGGVREYMLSVAAHPAVEAVITRISRLNSVIRAVVMEVKSILNTEGFSTDLNPNLLSFLLDFQAEVTSYLQFS